MANQPATEQQLKDALVIVANAELLDIVIPIGKLDVPWYDMAVPYVKAVVPQIKEFWKQAQPAVIDKALVALKQNINGLPGPGRVVVTVDRLKDDELARSMSDIHQDLWLASKLRENNIWQDIKTQLNKSKEGAALLKLTSLAIIARSSFKSLEIERGGYIARRDSVVDNLNKLAGLAIPVAVSDAMKAIYRPDLDLAQTVIDSTDPAVALDLFATYKARPLDSLTSVDITGPLSDLYFQIINVIALGELDRVRADTEPAVLDVLVQVSALDGGANRVPMENFVKQYKFGVPALLNLLRPGAEAKLVGVPRATALVKNIRQFLQLYAAPQGPFRIPFDKAIPADSDSSLLIACIVPALDYVDHNFKGVLTSDICTKAATQAANVVAVIKQVTLPPSVKVVQSGLLIGNISCPRAIGLGDFETTPCIYHVADECGPQPSLDKVNAYYADLWAACLQAKAEWTAAGKPSGSWPTDSKYRFKTAFTSWQIIITKAKNAPPKIHHASSGYEFSKWRNA